MADPLEKSRASTPHARLRRLDDLLVPRLQRGARSLGRVLGWPHRLLRTVDGRFAGGRPARAAHEHRGLVAFVVVALMFAAVAVHAQRYPVLRERARQAGADEGAEPGTNDVVPGSGADVEPVGTVGPLASARVEDYLDTHRQLLATAPADPARVAIVSFAAFLEPARAVALLDGLEVHRVQYRLPERTPRPTEVEVAGGDVTARLDQEIVDLVEELRAEEAEVASTLESGVEDEAFRADYEARRDELMALRNTLTSDPAIVFAAVVTGAVEDLRRLADEDDVRLVDLAPAGTSVDRTTFFGILPTDQDRFSFGRGV